MHGSLVFVIIGRPNVGKSTLFNRLVGSRSAIVGQLPGLTRDWKERDVVWGGLSFRLVDTAGLEVADSTALAGRMSLQTRKAISGSDVCLFLVDVRAGITPMDRYFARVLRKSGKPVTLIANKCEGKVAESGMYDAFSLGFGTPVAISAEHGEGLGDLYACFQSHMAGRQSDDAETASPEDSGDSRDSLRIAIVGRPNVGKSSLINRLVGQDRLLTGPESGITRDSIDVSWIWKGRSVSLWDTAGMRRKARVTESGEKLSVLDTLTTIRHADVVIVMLDAERPFEKQDLQIADLAISEGKSIVFAVNKWDLIEGNSRSVLQGLRRKVGDLLPQVRGVSLLPVSARSGYGFDPLMEAVFGAGEICMRRISTSVLNRFLEEVVQLNPPPAVTGRRVRLRYMTQVANRPPSFVLFSQRAESLPESYVRYLINRLRDTFDMPGVPIRIELRKIKNPYISFSRNKRSV